MYGELKARASPKVKGEQHGGLERLSKIENVELFAMMESQNKVQGAGGGFVGLGIFMDVGGWYWALRSLLGWLWWHWIFLRRWNV